jgi:hypothetical protein
MATSRTSHARSGHGAERLRVKSRRRSASKQCDRGDGRRPRVTVINAGFFVLAVSTAWVIASVSMWWVPVYVIMLVAIFGAPRRGPLLSSASATDAVCDVVGIAELEPGLRVDCADGAEQPRPLCRSDSVLTEGECTESSSARANSAPAGTPKQRRSRAQVRKSVPASERATGSVPVVWIKAGPGKFVRVEGGLEAANSAEIESVSSQAYSPATGSAATEIEAVPEQAVLPVESNPLESVEVTPADLEQSCLSDNRVSGSVTEEDGIAPSAPSLTPELKTAAKRRVIRNLRDLVCAVPKPGRVSRLCVIRTPLYSRLSVRSRLASNGRRQQAASRASGRMRHVPRDLRTRSPPGCLQVRGTGVKGREIHVGFVKCGAWPVKSVPAHSSIMNQRGHRISIASP